MIAMAKRKPKSKARAHAATVAEWIAVLRARHGLSQEEAASRIKVSTFTWQSWELGRRLPKRLTIMGIANEFGEPIPRHLLR